jgi:hypothetical protein
VPVTFLAGYPKTPAATALGTARHTASENQIAGNEALLDG